MTSSGHVVYGNAILRKAPRQRWGGEDGARTLDRPRSGGHGGGLGQPDAGHDAGGNTTRMRHRAAVRVALSALPSGQVKAVFRGANVAALGDMAVVLDGVLHGVLTLPPAAAGGRGSGGQGTGARGIGGRATRQAVIDLPPHLLFGTLDLLALPACRSLLLRPWALDAAYGLTVAAPVLDGLAVTGEFGGAPWLADVIGVALLDEGAVAGQGVAIRVPGQPVWRYQVALANLAAPGRGLSLALRVGGMMAKAAPVKIAPNALGLVGCVDVVTPTRVEGWALDLGAAESAVALDVLIDGDVVGTLRPDRKRADISVVNGEPGGVRCGFGFDLPSPEDGHVAKRIEVCVAGTRTGLLGSPAVIDPMPSLMGRFDTLHGMSAHGWALDRSQPGQKVSVEVIGPDGAVLAQGPATHFRGDLLGAGLADGLCAFKVDISAHYERLIGQEVSVRFAGTNVVVAGSPIRIMPNGNQQRFLRRRDILLNKPGVLPRLRRALNHRAGTTGISIIMPVYNTPRAWLSEALESVRHQFCDAWELICIDDGSTASHVRSLIESYAANDKRVRLLSSPQNVGVTRATNFGLRAAQYPYVTFLDHDDYLEPDAVWQLIRTARQTDADLIYGDEALTDEHLQGILEFRLRPAFSHDYYLSHPYFVHPICVRTEIARRIGGWDESLAISADVDFVLRVLEHANRVAHVPAVLYRWRTHEGSAGHARQEQVMAATQGALQRHLDRLGRGGQVSNGPWFNQFRVDWPSDDGLILIVMPTKNGRTFLQTAVESIERTAAGAQYRLVVIDHESDEPETRDYLREIAARHVVMPYSGVFNFSRMNNLAVAAHGGDAAYVLFLNNDIEATQDGWLDRLRSLAHRAEVGAVGALLMYVDKRVQHAGVVVGFNNSADHALRLQDVFLDDAGRRNLGYNCALTSVRDYSAVTAACLMMRIGVFRDVGGFEEKFGIGFNDTDLCLRVGSAGYKVLYDGYTILYHYESATRAQTKQVFHSADTRRMTRRWSKLLKAGDPFYNPNLSLRTQDHVPREDPDCRIVYPPRVVALR
jgi:GT2 family glycosyltransferase